MQVQQETQTASKATGEEQATPAKNNFDIIFGQFRSKRSKEEKIIISLDDDKDEEEEVGKVKLENEGEGKE